jgi:hypothetical protein
VQPAHVQSILIAEKKQHNTKTLNAASPFSLENSQENCLSNLLSLPSFKYHLDCLMSAMDVGTASALS